MDWSLIPLRLALLCYSLGFANAFVPLLGAGRRTVRLTPWLAGVGAVSVVVKIATVHTCFNVANTILFFPFAGLLGKLLIRVIPQKDHKEKPHLTSLDIRMLETPVIAIEQSRVEVLRMAEGCSKMMHWLAELAPQEVPDQALVQKLFHREEVLDTAQDEVVAFLSDLLASNLPHEVIDEGRRQLRVADEYESISDYIASILKFHMKLRDQGHAFDDEQSNQLRELHDLVRQGHLYLALPPLYRISQGGKTLYARDEAHREQLLATEFQGRGKVEISRFKGLGEMPPAQLKQTTMDPVKRTLLRVVLPEDDGKTADLVEQLMGRKAESRYRYIQDNAQFVTDLDI